MLTLILIIGLAATLVSGCGDKQAQKKFDFPKKPITLIIPWAPGGATDVAGRAIADAAGKHLGQPMVAVNKAGGSGSLAMEEALRAGADGYTVSLTAATIMLVQPQLKSVKYKADDFKIIANIVQNPLFLFVKGDSPWNSVKDLVEDAKKNNKIIKVGHPGVGSANDMGTSTFFNCVQLKTTEVPFKSNGETIAAIIGGHVDIGAFHPIESKEFVAAGKLKILGVFKPQRVDFYPNVPTIAEGLAEAGYDFKYKNLDFSPWYYLVVPKETPDDVYKFLVEKIKATVNEPAFREKAKQMNLVINLLEPEEIAKLVKDIETAYTSIMIETGKKK
jgi:tripartite-type tricarboxylate transporter receptor subunit TctC